MGAKDIAKDVKEYFYRHFLGTIKVHPLPVTVEPPQVHSPKHVVEVLQLDVHDDRVVEVHQDQMQSKVTIQGAELLAGRKVSCSSVGFRFAAQLLNINEAVVKKYAPGELRIRKFSKLLKADARQGMKRMSVLPQERANRLQWLTVRPPKKEGEVILAWFGPIVENAVAKLTLNKRRGTLLIWYNPQSRHFNVKSLYLCRRMGHKENVEWRWA